MRRFVWLAVVAATFVSGSASAQVEAVAHFTGPGNKATHPFHVSRPWKLHWMLEGDYIRVTLFAADGQRLGVVVSESQPGSGAIDIAGAGSFYLEVRGVGDWQIAVVEVDGDVPATDSRAHGLPAVEGTGPQPPPSGFDSCPPEVGLAGDGSSLYWHPSREVFSWQASVLNGTGNALDVAVLILLLGSNGETIATDSEFFQFAAGQRNNVQRSDYGKLPAGQLTAIDSFRLEFRCRIPGGGI